jgi:hypothetical protein
MSRATSTFGGARVALVVLAAAAGCNSSSAGQDNTPSAATSAHLPVATPADHLAAGELLDGPNRAMGVPLPQGFAVVASVGKVVYASGPADVHPLVEYLRTRLKDGELREGDSSATFDGVTAPGENGPPLAVHIVRTRGVSNIDIHDLTPPPTPPPLPDEAARWKAAGLTPSGRILDPTHLD